MIMMNMFTRLFNRKKFKKTIKSDQSRNVVDGMVKARQLYKELCVKAHPDRHLDRIDVAEELMKKVSENKYNYRELLNLKKEIQLKLFS